MCERERERLRERIMRWYPCNLQDISKQVSEAEKQAKMLSILKSVGPGGFLLLEPECRLILESKSNN